MKTAKEAMSDKLMNAWKNTPKAHQQTLLGERPAGSKWGNNGFDYSHLVVLDWVEFTPDAGVRNNACTYYQADISGVFQNATLGAVRAKDLPRAKHHYVRIADRTHGDYDELHIDAKHLGEAHKAACGKVNLATLILGPDEGLTVIYTVHPGEPMLPWSGRMVEVDPGTGTRFPWSYPHYEDDTAIKVVVS